MIIKTVQTLVFEYPEDYQAEVEWNKKRDGDWVHQSTDTMCSVYTITNNYLIPTKAKHSFLDNPYFEAEPSNSEKPNNCEPQLTPNYCGTCKHREVPCGDLPCDVCHGYSNYAPKDEPQTDIHDLTDCDFCKDRNCKDCVGGKDEPQTESVGVPFGMDEATFKSHCLNCRRDTADIKCLDCDGNKYFLPYGSQTDCAWR